MGAVLAAVIRRMFGGHLVRPRPLPCRAQAGAGADDGRRLAGPDRRRPARRQGHHRRPGPRPRPEDPLRHARHARPGPERRPDPALLHGDDAAWPRTSCERWSEAISTATPGRWTRCAARTPCPPRCATAMAAKDHGRVRPADRRRLAPNKRIDPDSSTPEVEAILGRLRPHMFGAKLLGAGRRRVPADGVQVAQGRPAVRRRLMAHPPNARARFFDYQISRRGLTVTVC